MTSRTGRRTGGIVVSIAGLVLALGLIPAVALADAEGQNASGQQAPEAAPIAVGEAAYQGDNPEAVAVEEPEGNSGKDPAKQPLTVQDAQLTTQNTCNITININNDTYGTVTGAGTYEIGNHVILTATPAYGCVFECWKEGDNVLGHDVTYSFDVKQSRTITAVFSNVIITDIPAQTYTGKQIKPDTSIFEIYLGNVDSQYNAHLNANYQLTNSLGYKPTENDYTLRYGENVNAGEAAGVVYVEFKGNFTGEASKKFGIAQADISDATVKAADQVYDGTELKPTPTVTWKDTQIEPSDYTASYANNVHVGTATVTVTGKRNFTKSSKASGTFEITKRPVTIAADSAERTYNGAPLSDDGFTSEGLANGDRVASAKVVGSQTEPGSSANTVSNAKIVNAAGKDVTDCYDITYKPGTLTIAPDYEATSGSGSTWAQHSAEAVTFTFMRSPAEETTLDHFTGVLVDGQVVPPKNFACNENWTAKKGSLVLSLQPVFLETLSVGEHVVKALFDDGSAEATFKVVAASAKNDKIPVVKMIAKGKTDLVVSWKKVKGAAGYDVFFARCNHDGKKIAVKKAATVKAGATLSWTKKDLKEGTAYKARVKAYVVKGGKKKYIGSSPLVHAFTSDGTATRTNAKSMSVNKTKVSLKKGKSFKLVATINKVDESKNLMPDSHVACVRYRSTDKKVATVTAKGKIKAKGKGVCYVYAYAHNGVYKRVKVTVK